MPVSLHRLLGFQIAPPVVGRRINLTAVWPVTSAALRETYFQDDGNGSWETTRGGEGREQDRERERGRGGKRKERGGRELELEYGDNQYFQDVAKL